MENILLKNHNFNVFPLANIFNNKISKKVLEKEKMFYKIDGHGTEYLHENIANEISLYFIKK